MRILIIGYLPPLAAECNNSTAFPGIGLGVVLSRARLLSDKMLVAASKALTAQSPALRDPKKPLLANVEDVRELSVKVAKAVIETAVEEGLAQQEGIPSGAVDGDGLEEWIRVLMWQAEYKPLKKRSWRAGTSWYFGIRDGRGGLAWAQKYEVMCWNAMTTHIFFTQFERCGIWWRKKKKKKNIDNKDIQLLYTFPFPSFQVSITLMLDGGNSSQENKKNGRNRIWNMNMYDIYHASCAYAMGRIG